MLFWHSVARLANFLLPVMQHPEWWKHNDTPDSTGKADLLWFSWSRYAALTRATQEQCWRVEVEQLEFEFSNTARLAQSVERKVLNLVVVGSSPTVGVLPIVGFAGASPTHRGFCWRISKCSGTER